jgi:hypothetical protein
MCIEALRMFSVIKDYYWNAQGIPINRFLLLSAAKYNMRAVCAVPTPPLSGNMRTLCAANQ